MTYSKKLKCIIYCKNCSHTIVKRYSSNNGESIVMWKHINGGTYCKVGDLGGCLCNKAEPINEVE